MTNGITPIEETGWDNATITEFNTLVEIRQQRKAAEDTAKKQREVIDKQIEAMLLLIGPAAKVPCGQLTVQRVNSNSASTLSKPKLLELGVSAATIKAATVDGKSYSYVLVTGGDKQQ